MTTSTRLFLVISLAACGGGGSGYEDPGGGTQTLRVVASATIEDGDASHDLEVTVDRAGDVAVTDAIVRIDSDAGDVTLTHDADGRYRGALPSAATGFSLQVTASADDLHGGAEAAALPLVTAPVAGFDPHTAVDGMVDLTWGGALAQRIEVKVSEFDHSGVDEGHVLVPATEFKEDTQEIEVERSNQVTLAGGLAGSTFSTRARVKARVPLTNSF